MKLASGLFRPRLQSQHFDVGDGHSTSQPKLRIVHATLNCVVFRFAQAASEHGIPIQLV